MARRIRVYRSSDWVISVKPPSYLHESAGFRFGFLRYLPCMSRKFVDPREEVGRLWKSSSRCRVVISMLLHAPAKINLFLELRGKMPSGFHELETVMSTISWFDTLSFQKNTTESIELKVMTVSEGGKSSAPQDDVPHGPDNLVYKAIESLRQEAGVQQGLSVKLLKRIPAQAGLGGGSSDAATALVGANELWGLGYSKQRLAQIAGRLGSDIPFFIYGGFARCTGRGEVIEPLRAYTNLSVVVVKPPVGLPTAEVFRNCSIPEQPETGQGLIEAIRHSDSRAIAGTMFNRLAEPASRLTPWIDKLCSEFERTGCLGALMSGSGSSCFGVYPNARVAREAASHLGTNMGLCVTVAHTLAG
ncbi:MAG: 4-(cytidine 5'-diphospho)-2-C-methyl-D-erythritol kinase [Planctomycetota bacterium]|nr:4-(cytidine 5'-diphospho)-2-C-methyl-D-erythritol kinase [Planctomycetota bacterium]